MATIVYNGSTNNWSSTAAWVGAVVPVAGDTVLIGTGTGGSTTGTLTVDGTTGSPSLCSTLTCTSFTGTLTMGATAVLTVGSSTAGNVTFVAGMTFTPNAASIINFIGTNATATQLTSGAKTLGNVVINTTSGGGVILESAFAIATTSVLTHTSGTLNTNGFTVACNNYNASNVATRALTLGATSWTISSLAAGSSFNIGVSTNMTLTKGTSTITMAAAANPMTFSGGGLAYHIVTSTNLTGTLTINQSNTFDTLTCSNGAGQFANYQFQAGTTQTVVGTLTGAGNSSINRLLYRSTIKGQQFTLNAATVTVSNIDIQDGVGAGAGSWNLTAITGLAGDMGNNSSITFPTPANQYWVPSAGTSTGNENVITRWANASNGTAGTGRIPLAQDTAIFDASSVSGAGVTITQGQARVCAHNFTGVTNTPAWALGGTAGVNSLIGAITLVAGMTVSGATSTYTVEGRGSTNITTAGLTWTAPIIIDAVNNVGSLKFVGAFASSSTLVTTTGTFDSLTNSVVTTFTSATLNGGTINLGANMTLSTTFLINGATLNLVTHNISGGTGMTFQNGTINGSGTLSGSTITFSGVGVVLNAIPCTITGSGAMTVSGSGSVFNVGSVTCAGAVSNVIGTVNMYGTISADTVLYVPHAGGAFTFGG